MIENGCSLHTVHRLGIQITIQKLGIQFTIHRLKMHENLQVHRCAFTALKRKCRQDVKGGKNALSSKKKHSTIIIHSDIIQKICILPSPITSVNITKKMHSTITIHSNIIQKTLIPPSPFTANPSFRVEIWRNWRSCKICASCVIFQEKNTLSVI